MLLRPPLLWTTTASSSPRRRSPHAAAPAVTDVRSIISDGTLLDETMHETLLLLLVQDEYYNKFVGK